eukprot:3827092-Amphidinium_carterae.2
MLVYCKTCRQQDQTISTTSLQRSTDVLKFGRMTCQTLKGLLSSAQQQKQASVARASQRGEDNSRAGQSP